MANDLSIDSLSIEITASGNSAAQALDGLIAKLQQLKQATAGGLTGVTSITKGLNQIAAAAQQFNSIDTSKFAGVVDALSRLKNIGDIGDLTNTAAQMKNVKKIANTIANIPTVPAEKIQSLRDLSSALSTLSTLPQMPNLSGTMRSISQLPTVAAALNAVNLRSMGSQIRSFTSALQPLTQIGRTNISGIVNSLRRLPEISSSLSSLDMGQFSAQMQSIATAVTPFADQMERLGNAFNALPAPIRSAISAMGGYNRTSQQSATNTTMFGNALRMLNFAGIIAAVRRVSRYMASWITASNEYVENLNLFTVAMGDASDEALEFAERVNEVMGIDVSQWVENQGLFKQLVSGFGMVSDKANLVSQNMTQLGYDIASYFNISVADAMQKLQSGLSGEIEPLRRLGYAIDVATLQQTAYNHGIEMSVENMSQAQKAQLRYITIMEQSNNVMGDMARTIESPANQIRILQSRLETLARTAGDAIMPMVSFMLPYVTAFVQILGEALRALADFLGFELPVFDYSSVISDSNEAVTSSFEDATAAAKEFKGTLSSIDQLNIIGSTKENGGSGGDGGSMFDLDLALPSYDFLGGLEAETSEAYGIIKSFLTNTKPYVDAIAAMFVGFGAVTYVSKAISALAALKTAHPVLSKFTVGLGAALATLVGFKDVVKGLVKGDLSIAHLVTVIGLAVAGIVALVAVGNPFAAIAVGAAALIGSMWGVVEAQNEIDKAFADTIVYTDNAGISISGLADGFESYFSQIKNNHQDIINTSNAIETNKAKVDEAAEAISNMTDKYIALGGEMTKEDAESIVSNLEIIHDGISENLGTATQSIVDSLKDKFSTFAEQLGYDVDDMVGKFYLLETMGNESLAQLRKRADELAMAVSEGDLSKLEELNEVVQKMAVPDVKSTAVVGFEMAISQAEVAKIDFESEDAVKQALQNVQTKAEEASKSIQEAWYSQIAQLDALEEEYISLGVNVDYDKQFGAGEFDKLFAETRKVLDEGFGNELTKIDVGEGVFLAMVQSAFDDYRAQAKNAISPNMWETIQGWGASYLTKRDSVLIAAATDWDTSSRLATATPEEYADIAKNQRIDELYAPIQAAIDEASAGLDYSAFTEDGKNILDGIANGVVSSQDDLNAAIDQISESAQTEMQRANGIHSPSTVYAEYGKYLMEGLANGISNNSYQVIAVIDELTLLMAAKMKKLSEIAFADIPDYTTEDFNAAVRGDWSITSNTAKATTTENDPRAIMEFFQIGNSITNDENGIDINLHSTVEIDGDAVGEAVARYMYRSEYASNGTS